MTVHFDPIPHFGCQEITEVVGRFASAQSLSGNVLAMAVLTRRCPETAVHGLDCVINMPEDAVAEVVEWRMARAREDRRRGESEDCE